MVRQVRTLFPFSVEGSSLKLFSCLKRTRQTASMAGWLGLGLAGSGLVCLGRASQKKTIVTDLSCCSKSRTFTLKEDLGRELDLLRSAVLALPTIELV